MATTTSALFSRLKPDPWRKQTPFSEDIAAANAALFVEASPEASAELLNRWIQKNQPCLFGKAGATLGLISYCILNESDILGPEDSLMAKIQAARTAWTREAFYGRKSAFVVSLISPTLATAIPDDTVREFARRICSLYLETDIKDNEVHLEDVFLEMPGQRQTTWKWRAGVNYFSSQGDGRWWRDHRIPGGMAFSVNSVGHMAKSGKLAAAMQQFIKALGAPEEEWEASKIDSLDKALVLAMRTIANAFPAISGKATELLPMPAEISELPRCPVELPKDLADKNYCEYKGHYHTDYTLPEEYFRPDVLRPPETKTHRLDFTYIYHRTQDNPSFFAMGEGQQIRTDSDATEASPADAVSAFLKRLKANEEAIQLSQSPRLLRALSH